LNYERLYAYRFRDVDQDARIAVWREIGPHVHELMGRPDKVLDPAAGRGEFIGAVPAAETWAVDEVSYPEAAHKPDTTVIVSPIMDAELPAEHFDGVFVSNFLEHLHDQEAIAAFLEKMRGATEPGGRIAIMGPNYRYCSNEYWDCADHYVALTHVAIAEHLYAAGFEPQRIVPRYLPYSFRGILPPSRALTRLYLKTPPAWRLLGKQFLVIGSRTA
jgi:SAM-dependent methyltransferase